MSVPLRKYNRFQPTAVSTEHKHFGALFPCIIRPQVYNTNTQSAAIPGVSDVICSQTNEVYLITYSISRRPCMFRDFPSDLVSCSNRALGPAASAKGAGLKPTVNHEFCSCATVPRGPSLMLFRLSPAYLF